MDKSHFDVSYLSEPFDGFDFIEGCGRVVPT